MKKLDHLKTVLRDRLYRRRNSIPKSLEAPTEREQKLIDELRSTFKTLPEDAPLATEADEAWIKYQKRIHFLVGSEDPRAFLRWDAISDSMFVSNAAYVEQELAFLRREEQWQNRWRTAIEESSIGCPTPYFLYPSSSGNLIHHAYHLCQFENSSGNRVDELDLVWEFGGGYGSMCRLFYNLGFKGRYIIFDFPPVSALQRFFLESLNMPLISIEDGIQGKAGVVLVSDIGQLKRLLAEIRFAALRKTAFVATWSISETPRGFREAVLDLAADFDCFLIAYCEEFGGINNLEYMDAWKSTLGGQWQSWPIEHLPGNRYLIGVKDQKLSK